MITSIHNDRLKDVRRLSRRRDGRFVAEGEDLLAAAAVAGWTALDVLHAGTDVEPELLARVSTLGSGTRALGVFAERWAPAASAPCVALWGVRDPGNVGTVLRAAHAFGAACVAIGPGTADPFGAKAVRASMGAIFAVPVARVDAVAQLPAPRVALVARAGEPLGSGDGAGTLLVGAERVGLPAEAVAECERAVHIPLRAGDSLNAAMAATIALYAASGA